MSAEPASDAWRALVAFTTSSRPEYVRRYLPHLARACLHDARLELLVALDGDDPGTRSFCERWRVPLLYSEAREGVGISKNRVLEWFPGYDYYFFVEDDTEVLDGTLFARQVALMQASGIHHMSVFPVVAGRHVATGETVVDGRRILHFPYGGAHLNAFTRHGLERVGGWHPLFAQYRRWGHTEHSYRFPRSGLAPAPFNVAADLVDACILHVPPSVTSWVGLAEVDSDGIAAPERELMREELTYVPLRTLSRYHVEGPAPGALPMLAQTLEGRRNRYPLLHGSEWRHAQADYLVRRSEMSHGAVRSLALLLLAAIICPSNIALRHAVKVRVLRTRT